MPLRHTRMEIDHVARNHLAHYSDHRPARRLQRNRRRTFLWDRLLRRRRPWPGARHRADLGADGKNLIRSAGVMGTLKEGPQAAPASPTPEWPITALKGKRVLIVEDEPLLSMDMEASLTEIGCEIGGPAGTLEKARQLIAGSDCDA